MLLAARPDLTWIVIGGLLVLVMWMVGTIIEMNKSTRGGVSRQERRNFIKTGVSLTFGVVLAAYMLPDAIDSMETDDSESRILRIGSGEEYTVESGETETWLAVYDNGVLNLNGTIELKG